MNPFERTTTVFCSSQEQRNTLLTILRCVYTINPNAWDDRDIDGDYERYPYVTWVETHDYFSVHKSGVAPSNLISMGEFTRICGIESPVLGKISYSNFSVTKHRMI